MNPLTLIPTAVLAGMALGGLLGYQGGTRDLARLREQLATLHRTLDAEQRSYQATQQDLQRNADQAAQAHRESQARLVADAASKQQRLVATNADAQQRIADFRGQLATLDHARSLLANSPATGDDESASRQARLDALDRERQVDQAQLTGLACLSAVVPDLQLAVLRD